ncbi:MAG: hypothetical protein N2442_09165 [Spirochaetes bacterium]|nr:hypothetical protein [Spirochaetota bacterium]
MSEENDVSKKKTLTKTQAMAVMGIGGGLFLLSILVPVQQGTTLYTVKVIAGILGFCVLCVGAYLRPVNKAKGS